MLPLPLGNGSVQAMSTRFTALTILSAINGVALVGAFAAWYYSLDRYRAVMSDRAELAMAYALPPFMLVTASPAFDVALLAMGYPFPTLGLVPLGIGLAGSAVTLAYVVTDIRRSMGDPRTPDPVAVAGVEQTTSSDDEADGN